MTRLAALALTLVLAILTALPATAEDDLRLEPCDTTNPVLTLEGLEATLAMPVLTGDNITGYTLDLSGQDSVEGVDHSDRARISATLSWDLVVNDYDLTLGGTTTEGFQPIDAPEEFATANFTHCQTVVAGAVNFTATGGDSVNLFLDVSLR